MSAPATPAQTPAPTPAPAPASTAPESSSVNFRLEELEGQSVLKWFKDEFGAKGNIEFAPKFKSNRGFIKGKLNVVPRGSSVDINEELEIQTTINERDGLFKIKQKELTGHFDLGFHQAGTSWINPFLKVNIPRAAPLNGVSTTTLGLIFYHIQPKGLSLQTQLELDIQQAQNEANKSTSRFDLTTNLALRYRNFILALHEKWGLTDHFTSVTRFSLAGSRDKLQGFAEAQVTGLHNFTGLTFGGRYQFCKKLGLYARANKSLTDLKALPQVHLGFDYEHCKGFGLKTAVDVSGQTLSENINFTLNKTFSGSFLFDTTLDESKKLQFRWGAKLKFNC